MKDNSIEEDFENPQDHLFQSPTPNKVQGLSEQDSKTETGEMGNLVIDDSQEDSGEKITDSTNQKYIWDAPGFHDQNESPYQEIANQYYVNMLIKNTERAKFLIVISEDQILYNHASIFKEVIENFSAIFKDY